MPFLLQALPAVVAAPSAAGWDWSKVLDVLKLAAIPAGLWLLNRFVTKRDKRQDELRQDLAMTTKTRNEAADRERREMQEEIKRLMARVELHEQRLTGMQLTDEGIHRDLGTIKQQLMATQQLANENKLRGENLREALNRIEASLSNLIQQLIQR